METFNPAGDTSVSSKRRRRQKGKKKVTSQIVDLMDVNLEAAKIRGDCEIADNNLEINQLEVLSTSQLPMGHATTDGGLREGSSRGKKRKRKKRIKKIQNNDEVQSMNQTNSMSNIQLADKNLGHEIDDGITENEGGQSTNQKKMDVKPTASLSVSKVNAKRKRKKKKVKSEAGNNGEVKSRDQSNSMSYLQLSDKSLRQDIDDKLANNESIRQTNQDMIDKETVNLTEGCVNQSTRQLHSMSKLQLSDTNFKQEICNKLAVYMDVQHTNQNKTDTEPTVLLAKGNVSAKRKRKKKRIKGKTGNKDELQSMDQNNESIRQTNQDMIDKETVNLTEGCVNQNMRQSHSMSKLQLSDTNFKQEICNKLAVNMDVQHTNQNKTDTEPTVLLAKGNVSAKRKRKKKRIKGKTGNKDELQSMDQNNESIRQTNQDMIDKETVILTEGCVNQNIRQSHSMSNLQLSDTNFKQEICNKLPVNMDVQHTNQNKMDTEPTVLLAKGNVSAKRKRKNKRIKGKTGNKDELQSMDQSNFASNLQSDNRLTPEIDNKLAENEDVRSTDQSKMDINLSCNLGECNTSTKGKKRRKMSKSKDKNKDEVQSMDQAHDISNLQLSKINIDRELDGLNNGISVVEGTTNLGPSGVKTAEFLSNDLGEYPSRPPTTTNRRKLLVLDVNGLLAYIVMPAPKGRQADKNILRRAVFKRPFCDDFLNFCFQNFDVGIWSSRAKEVIDRIVDYLLGNRKEKLLFCWNMSHSTQTGFKTLENIHKPLVCKELRKIWENDHGKFSWKKGQYNESNTLLIDDSPYKALLNPLHTAIFPHPYHYEDRDDNSLGPGGHIRVYLEGLLKSENVQEYVEHHPFGQSAINETNVSWQFYSGVLQKFPNKIQARKNPTSVLTLGQNLTSPPPDKVVVLEHSSIDHSTAIPINAIDPEVHPIRSSLVVSASL